MERRPVTVMTYNNRPDLYDSRYEKATRNMIRRHLSVPHAHIHCRGGHDSWHIVDLFRYAPFLLVALDAIIVGSLDECVRMGCFTAIEEWKIPYEPNLSLAWVEGVEGLHREFKANEARIREKYPWSAHAEQAWLKGKCSFYPKQWATSYKYHGAPKEDTKMVVFHGKPKPHEVNDEWVRENWR